MANRGGTGAGENRRHRCQVDSVAVVSPSASLEISCNLPTVPMMCGLQGWADLPEGLLHSIIPLLVSFPDIPAFAATCPSWRAAFSSYPSKSSFSTRLPPLLILPDVPLCSPRPRTYSSSLLPRRPCYATNLASQNMYMSFQIPRFCHFNMKGLPSPLNKFIFIGASYGHLILSNKRSCLLVDVFTGVAVSPPQLPVNEDTQLHHATLTAPLASPNSHLIVTTMSANFFWPVGSHSWLRGSPLNGLIKQAVVFKGQLFVTDVSCHLFTVQLVPHISIQRIAVDWGEITGIHRLLQFSQIWLVACGDMLLMVGFPQYLPSVANTFRVLRLDLSAERAKWVKVEKLENWAIFISADERSQALCCVDPEIWGGRSNCIYCYDSEEWIACELGKPLKVGASTPRFECGNMMQPMWVVPSMFYSCP